MRHWREREFERHPMPKGFRFGLKSWLFRSLTAFGFHLHSTLVGKLLKRPGGKSGRIKTRWPQGWTAWRDMPAPQGKNLPATLGAEQQRPSHTSSRDAILGTPGVN